MYPQESPHETAHLDHQVPDLIRMGSTSIPVLGVTIFAAILLAGPAAAAPPPLRLTVDAGEAARHILHARLAVPASPGPLTLVYPKWIPGEHGPTGPIAGLVGLRIAAAGKELPWHRDPEDLYAFHIEVPPRTTALEVAFDVIPGSPGSRHSADVSSSAQVAIVSWNQLVLYPAGAAAGAVAVQAALVLPPGWRQATALSAVKQTGNRTEYAVVSLETLVDSPVLAGRIFRTYDLSPGATPSHRLQVAAESETAANLDDVLVLHYRQLVAEAGALFGGRPYRSYQFLLTLSDQIASFGLEHHESSDDRLRERAFLDESLRPFGVGLLPHEFVHAWNGKLRRPAGLATPDFQRPMHTELLWVYEGLTSYLGDVLAARSGLRTIDQAREALALTAATLDTAPGRTWRSLADTAVSAPFLYGLPREWRAWRRGVDFYPESQLIWLEVDTVLRRAGHSLDELCRAFHAATPGPPRVVPYSYDDLLAALDRIAPQDWRAFFAARLEVPTARAPLGGLEAAGFRLVYQPQPSRIFKASEKAGKHVDLSFSLGMVVREDGSLVDVLPGSPAARAGLAPGVRLAAVNGRRFNPDVLRDTVAATRAHPDVQLLVENAEVFTSYTVHYTGGARYPILERIKDRPDLLEAIWRPLAR
jgi:predicted metalloprotease with PDZ domain